MLVKVYGQTVCQRASNNIPMLEKLFSESSDQATCANLCQFLKSGLVRGTLRGTGPALSRRVPFAGCDPVPSGSSMRKLST